MTKSNQNHPWRLVLSAFFLALAMVLPFFTGQIKTVGNLFCPMHLPVLLCGFFCGPIYGLLVGLIAPLWRSLQFGMPELFPTGVAMALELATYGLLSGLLYRLLPKKKLSVYLSLLCAMLAGRVVWGLVSLIFYGLLDSPFGWSAFFTGAFLKAIPGIILQIVLVPILVITLRKKLPWDEDA